MDYTTTVGWGLTQHRARDLDRQNEQRRIVRQRAGDAAPGGQRIGTRGRLDRTTVTSPRFILPLVAIGAMGALLGFAAVPAASAPAAPAPAVIHHSGPAGHLPGGVFIAR